MRQRVNSELDKEPPRLGCGCKSSVPSGIECAIASDIKTFTNLANSGMNIKATRHTLIARVEACLTQGGIHFRQSYDYYDKVLRRISDKISDNTGSSKMEERRAIWTTYWHINDWFDTLKEFLISHGFYRLSTEKEMKETGS